MKNIYKEWREKQGLTQLQVAKALKVQVQFLSSIERGLAHVPVKKIGKFSKTVGVPVERIIEMRVNEFKKDLFKAVKTDARPRS